MMSHINTPGAPGVFRKLWAIFVAVSTSEFIHQLSSEDTNVQKALNTIDKTVAVNRTFIDTTEQFTIGTNKQMVNCDTVEILGSLVIDGGLCIL